MTNTYEINENGQMEIGGVNVLSLKEKYGTPLYVFNQNKIEEIASVFSNTLKSEYGEGLISYASKAFSCKEIYRIMDNLGLGTDTVSIGELYTAVSVGFNTEKVIFHGNNKSIEELSFAVKTGVKYIVLDSVYEAQLLNDIARETGKVQGVLIRVNPGVEAHTHNYIQTAKPDSKFGFLISNGDAKEAIKSVLALKNLNLLGLHCHIGSQIFEENSFLLATDIMLDFYKKIKDEFDYSFSVLNLGGGFGIKYIDSDPTFTLFDYQLFIKKIINEVKLKVKNNGLEKPFLIFEPGRSIVGKAGLTLYSAGYTKEIKGIKNYLAVNGGMSDNPRFALYGAKYTVLAAERLLDKKDTKYTIAGKCCESGDIIAENVMLPKAKYGETIAVLSTGAYNYSMASNYNRNLIPPVVFIKNGKDRLVVKGQTLDDLIRNDL
ncbi:MAG: diaminopimelate decarboxylase [Clostridia bacterium]|nr:diaminopimelate decarboxylase [Clostridia bacterium]